MADSSDLRQTAVEPERALALAWLPPDRRDAVRTLFALDARLAALARFTRDAHVAQMRLTWWYQAIEALDTRPAPAEPLLQAIQRHILPSVRGAELVAMVEGWEELLDAEPLDDDRLEAFADRRGAVLFAALARILGAAEGDPVGAAGKGWALVDFAAQSPDRAAAARAQHLADRHLTAATAVRWSRAGRPIGALAHLATIPLRSPAARSLRVLRHRLTGR
ncbi:squalene/phytoene synthase family protein [Roseomonas aeriglobus]|nr:squalene/phytoene synthase family protein [Roseomonas aeriglobus]